MSLMQRDTCIAYLNINGNANIKLQPNQPLNKIIQIQLKQPDILAVVEVKKDAKLNKNFTKLKGYGTYFIPTDNREQWNAN